MALGKVNQWVMDANSTFWRTFYGHSLQVPWIIGPEAQPVVEPVEEAPVEVKTEVKAEPKKPAPVVETSEPFIFITTKLSESPALAKMLERMIVAIRKDDESLVTKEVADKTEARKILSSLNSEQKALVFGQSLWPAKKIENGSWISAKSGAQVMLTHDLLDLKANPALKKYTWEHLQSFVGLK